MEKLIIEIPYKEDEISVTFFGTPTNEDSGEDSGEAWGAKYLATHNYYITCGDTIEWINEGFTQEEIIVIQKYLDDNYDKVDKLICQKFEKNNV